MLIPLLGRHLTGRLRIAKSLVKSLVTLLVAFSDLARVQIGRWSTALPIGTPSSFIRLLSSNKLFLLRCVSFPFARPPSVRFAFIISVSCISSNPFFSWPVGSALLPLLLFATRSYPFLHISPSSLYVAFTDSTRPNLFPSMSSHITSSSPSNLQAPSWLIGIGLVLSRCQPDRFRRSIAASRVQ